ncbi:hypothetical protein BCR43DRAFT_484938 [Syncephalastrum racemosum]|uniref:TRP C-terminal domain-containing protein n=1 Tax=Syncephalastrum racemosum TaxID=13706 RepID=A0A1X2HLS5_SYNRA|nr:hypothetical protein BCR43DRAFT_484938 [Syncephalastrum racemosum]
MSTRRRRRYFQGKRLVFLLIFILSWHTLPARGEPLAGVLFSPNTNFTQCSDATIFNVSTVERIYDTVTNAYDLSINATTGIAVTELNPELTVYSTARTEVILGFQTVYNELQALCPDIANGCPVNENKTVQLRKSFVLPGTGLPFADIITRYTAYPSTGNGSAWACVAFAPIGYLNPVWQKVFLYLSISFTVFAALVSLISCFATVSNTDHDLLLLTSNYCMLPAALRLRTPGFFDIIYYCQFVVVSGLLTLDYPRFYPLFTSIFSWSFLLVPADWIQNDIVDAIFSKWVPTSDEQGVNVVGTGMNVFSQAVDISVNGFFITALLYFALIVTAATCLCGALCAGVALLSRVSPFRFGGQFRKVGNFTIGTYTFPLF